MLGVYRGIKPYHLLEELIVERVINLGGLPQERRAHSEMRHPCGNR